MLIILNTGIKFKILHLKLREKLFSNSKVFFFYVYWPFPIFSESVISLGDNKVKIAQGNIINSFNSYASSNFFCLLFHVLCIWTTHLVRTRHQTSHMSNLHASPEDSHRPVSKETAVTQALNKIFCSEQNVSKDFFFFFTLLWHS